MERIILTTGGTGGHIFPALAVAEALQHRFTGVKIIFVGSVYGPEGDLARRAGLEFVGLPVRGFLGRGLRALGAAVGMVRAFRQIFFLVRRFQPQAVAGFGGYAAFAPVLVAGLCGIPTAIHEQNAIAGVSNKILARLANKVFFSLPGTVGFPLAKGILTGNPVRHAVAHAGDAAHDYRGRRLLIMGGSQGARAINEVIMAGLPRLIAAGVHLRHQTGQADAARMAAAYRTAGYDAACVSPFIVDMAGAYAWADLVFCRAGATSVAELAAAGRPSVLVPFPYATHDHQAYNARILAENGAAMMLLEKDMYQVDTVSLLLGLLDDADTLRAMGQVARSQARLKAAADVVDQLELLTAC